MSVSSLKPLSRVIPDFARRLTLRFAHRFMPARALNMNFLAREDLWNDYYEMAESGIDVQWDRDVWPAIQDFDFTSVLELAPGAGRNTQKLLKIAKKMCLVEYKEYALEMCEKRFGNVYNGVPITYIVNNGRDLRSVRNHSITTIYCYDSAVHFDRSVLEDYIHEFSRVMTPGANGFVHHSTLGDKANPDIRRNPHWRSNMTKELFVQYCKDARLAVLKQIDIPWSGIVDCATVFTKPI